MLDLVVETVGHVRLLRLDRLERAPEFRGR
jgi:hypothetical protein